MDEKAAARLRKLLEARLGKGYFCDGLSRILHKLEREIDLREESSNPFEDPYHFLTPGYFSHPELNVEEPDNSCIDREQEGEDVEFFQGKSNDGASDCEDGGESSSCSGASEPVASPKREQSRVGEESNPKRRYFMRQSLPNINFESDDSDDTDNEGAGDERVRTDTADISESEEGQSGVHTTAGVDYREEHISRASDGSEYYSCSDEDDVKKAASSDSERSRQDPKHSISEHLDQVAPETQYVGYGYRVSTVMEAGHIDGSPEHSAIQSKSNESPGLLYVGEFSEDMETLIPRNTRFPKPVHFKLSEKAHWSPIVDRTLARDHLYDVSEGEADHPDIFQELTHLPEGTHVEPSPFRFGEVVREAKGSAASPLAPKELSKQLTPSRRSSFETFDVTLAGISPISRCSPSNASGRLGSLSPDSPLHMDERSREKLLPKSENADNPPKMFTHFAGTNELTGVQSIQIAQRISDMNDEKYKRAKEAGVKSEDAHASNDDTDDESGVVIFDGTPRKPVPASVWESMPTRKTPIPRSVKGTVTPSAAFARRREELARELYKEFNSNVFDSQLPADMDVSWSKTLLKTAGRAFQTRERKNGIDEHVARIELSTKVVDEEGKLRNTLMHEMCHCAQWIINKISNPPHGQVFKYWGARAEKVFPDIKVTTCHSYEISYKYRYQCVNDDCGRSYGRHSKSINTETHRCGYCRAMLILVQPERTKKDGTPHKENRFNRFVKENFAKVRRENPDLAQRDVMALLGKQFRQLDIE